METDLQDSEAAVAARHDLDEHVRDIVRWHFSEETGCSFWLDFRKRLDFDPLADVQGFDDLKRFPPFEDEWLRGGPVRRWIPAPYPDRPLYGFETGGTTGIPKSRTSVDDFRIDYELFSAVLSEDHFPPGSNWLMLGPSGPRRLRLAVEIQSNRILDADVRPAGHARHDQLGQTAHEPRVKRADRRHFEDLPVDQLHPVVLGEDPRFAHACEFVDREAVPLEIGNAFLLCCQGHGAPSSRSNGAFPS